MSTEKNKTAVRRVVEEAINKGNLAVLDEVMASNYVYHFPGMEVKGPDGFKQFITMMRAAFPDFHITVDTLVAEGDMVAVRLIITGTNKGNLMGTAPTGKKMTITEAVFIRFAGGKEVEASPTIDRLDMFQQLGIPIPAQ
jgi:predicted ester cyclase